MKKNKVSAVLLLAVFCIVITSILGFVLKREHGEEGKLKDQLDQLEEKIYRKDLQCQEVIGDIDELKEQIEVQEAIQTQKGEKTKRTEKQEDFHSNFYGGKNLFKYYGEIEEQYGDYANNGLIIQENIISGEKKMIYNRFTIERIIGVQDGWLYLTGKFGMDVGGSFYRIKLDGTKKEMLYSYSTDKGIILSDGYIYFALRPDEPEEYYLYRISIEGGKLKKIIDFPCDPYNFLVADEWIYFSHSENKFTYKARVDGTDIDKLLKRRVSLIKVVGDWIYCLDSKDETYRFHLDGSGWEKI